MKWIQICLIVSLMWLVHGNLHCAKTNATIDTLGQEVSKLKEQEEPDCDCCAPEQSENSEKVKVATNKVKGEIKSSILCQTHKLPQSECPWCKPQLVETLGWCKNHDVPQAYCTRCNPKLIPSFKLEGDWCRGHNLPESQCKKCRGTAHHKKVMEKLKSKWKVTRGYLKKKEISQTRTLATPQIGSPKSDIKLSTKSKIEGLKSQRKSNSDCDNEGQIVEFRDNQVVNSVGVKTTGVFSSNSGSFVKCNAYIHFNENLRANISPRSEGIVMEVSKGLGDLVKKGETLAKIHSVIFASARSEYFQAITLNKLWQQNYTDELALQKKGATAHREVLQAKTKVVETQIAIERGIQKLLNLGLSQKSILKLAENKTKNAVLSIIAPFDGIIVNRHAVIGETVSKDHPLFTVADTNIMWAYLDIFPHQIGLVQIGNPVEVEILELNSQIFHGNIGWISNTIDKETGTLKARVVLSNESGNLRDGMFAKAKIKYSSDEPHLLVPRDSVQWDGCCNVIFIKKSDNSFETRKVELLDGHGAPEFHRIHNNLPPGAQVVTTGAFLLKTELMKGNIGAGCCEI